MEDDYLDYNGLNLNEAINEMLHEAYEGVGVDLYEGKWYHMPFFQLPLINHPVHDKIILN